MSGKKFSEQHRVVYYETNVTKQINIGHMVDLLILTSENQSDQLGLTTEVVNSYGCGWVITQHLIDITHLPQNDEVVTLSTQAQSYNPYFCYRDFWIHDQTGQELVHMHSVFVLMDLKTRKIIRMIPELITPYEALESKKIERLAAPQPLTLVNGQKQYNVRFMDIDSNHHVNNVHYFDWMLDCLDAAFLSQHELVKMNIQYKQEVRYGQKVTSQVYFKDDLTTCHQIVTADNINCLAQCEWRKKDA